MDTDEFITALVVSVFSALITWVLVIFVVSWLIGGLALKLYVLSDEGEAWFPITFGIPVGFLYAIGMFAICFRKIRGNGQSQ